MDVKPSRALHFPPFRLDPDNALLWRGQTEVRLTPKAFAVLHCLVERHGQLVTKDALLERVWPGTVVGDAVLKVCVRQIRKAIGDQVEAPRFVATVHRRGYRFIADVTDVDPRPERGEASARPAADAGGPGRVSYRGPAHFVGRDAMLDRLQTRLDAAWRGLRQVVFVTGEPGIGKTSVVDAFLGRLAADPRVWIAHGQCVETYGTREPYSPVLDALGRLCRDIGGNWLVTLLRRYAPTWLMQMPWLLDPSGRTELQQQLLGATRPRMLRELAEMLEALTAEAPLVMVLEDMHWSDEATVELISFLARRSQPARLLVIGTYRAVDLSVHRHHLQQVRLELGAAGRCQELSLELLDEAAVGEYLRQRFAHNTFPPGLAQVVDRRTEGNPLFIVGVVDDLVRRGLIAMRDDHWELRAGLQEVEGSVPESLRQMIERRIAQLDEEQRPILAAGSVAGLEFSAASVAAALQQPTGDVEERCNDLARRQLFIRSLGAREWPDRTVAYAYAFTHSLHRSAFYQGITPARRRYLHQAIGQREELGHGDRAGDIAGRLAAHFEQAGDDRRAARYLAEAAETASRRYANAEAVDYVSRALDIAERLPDGERVAARLSLLKQLGLLRRSMGAVRDSIEDFTARARYAQAHGRDDEEVRALLELAGALSWVDRDRSFAAIEQALGIVPRLHDVALQAHVRGSHAFQRILLRGWRDEDAETCRLSLDIVRRVGERRHLSLHVGRYAHLQNHRAEYRAACRTAEEALRLAVEVSDAYHYMAAQFHRAWALLHLGEWGELRRVLHDGLEMAERNGHDLWARAFRLQTAWLFTHTGDFARARALCERERQPGAEVQLGEFLGSIVLGFAELGASRYAAALRAFEEVTAHPEKGRLSLMDWILNLPMRLGLGRYWLARRQFGRAREQMQALCRLAAVPGERAYLALGYQGLAEASLGEGDRAKAEREVTDALGILDGLESPVAEWRVCATAARVEEARGRRSRAEAYWGRGAAAIDRLATCLKDDGDLYRSFIAQPAVEAVYRNAKSSADTAPPASATPHGRVGRRRSSHRHQPRS